MDPIKIRYWCRVLKNCQHGNKAENEILFYVNKWVIIFVIKLKMVTRDPLIGNGDDTEWDACS